MNRLDESKERIKSALEHAKKDLQPLDRWVREMASNHPFATLAGALGIGYVIGRLFRRTVGA